MNSFKNKFKKDISNIFLYKKPEKYEFTLPSFSPNSEDGCNDLPFDIELEITNQDIDTDINKNLDFIKVKYNSLINSDIDIREFSINVRDKRYNAFLIYIDGMASTDSINNFILKPLMLRNRANTYDKKNDDKITKNSGNVEITKNDSFSLKEHISNCLLPENKVTPYTSFSDVISDINVGNCALFVDSLNVAFSIDVKNFKQRSISQPQNEIIIRGSQEAFVEALRTNTSMLRRAINNEDLIIENSVIGKISHTKIAICYMKNIANADLVAEVQYRVNNLDIDYLISSGQLEQLIQDSDYSLFPQIIATERLDKASNYLLEGRVVVIVNGSPYVLIMPGVLNDFLSSPEDINLKFQFSNLTKIIRLISAFLSILLPGLYVAITNYHQELIPTELLFAIASSREAVPFPIIFEILIMEVAFELIREAGLRVSSPIGPTIGIVGALILGEAAVSANVVSPILIIIVAITGLCSFAIPDLSLNFTFRILKFWYLFLGYICGFLGIGLGLFIQLTALSGLTSFGAPYIIPYLSKGNSRTQNSYFIFPTWKRERKPSFLNAKKPYSQEKISMRWKSTNK